MGSLLAFVLLFPTITISAVLFVVLKQQQMYDQDRSVYIIESFPPDLTEQQVQAFLRAISGTLRKKPFSFGGAPTIIFETWADARSIQHRVIVYRRHAQYVVDTLHTHVPGMRLVLEEEHRPYKFTLGVEQGEQRKGRLLRTVDAAETARVMLTHVQNLNRGEELLMQWVITPAIPQRKPQRGAISNDAGVLRTLTGSYQASNDELNDRRAKLDQQNFMASLRLLSYAPTEPAANHLIRKVERALGSFRTGDNGFFRCRTPNKYVITKAREYRSNVIYPACLAVSELAGLLAFPIDAPAIAGLPQGRTRQLPASTSIPTKGVILGTATFPGQERPVAVGYPELTMHALVTGVTSAGKSTLLVNMAQQIMQQGKGLISIEVEGNLHDEVLNRVPPNRLNDVVVLDVRDQTRPLGFNPLDQIGSASVVDEVIALLEHQYGRNKAGVWAQEYAYHGLRTIASANLAFSDLIPLLGARTSEEVAWADAVTREVQDEELRRFWQRHDSRARLERDQRADPVLSRMWKFTRPELRYITGQTASSFQMLDILNGNKILLVNLKGAPAEGAGLLATLLMNSLWSAIRTSKKSDQTFVLLDEFREIMNLPINMEAILSQARKYGVGFILANQHMSQLNTEMRDAVLANARTKLMFTISDSDARLVTPEFSGRVEPHDFVNLQNYEVLARIQSPSGKAPAVTMTTFPASRPLNTAKAAMRRSQQAYGRPLSEVEAEIRQRRTPKESPRTRRPARG